MTTKTVLITGATRGLGEGMARQFAAAGYRLALTGRKQQDLDRLGAELAGQAADIVLETLDVTDFDAIAGVIDRCAARLQVIDIVIVNAGVGFPTPVGAGHADLIRQTIDVNLTAAILTCEAAVELFRRQGHGHLVGISSVAATRGLPAQGVYCATKSGFSRYLQSVRLETRRDSIAVTDLAPGFIDSDMSRSVPNRMFTVSTEQGTRIMFHLIERRVRFRYVPVWPWTLIAQFMKWLPDSVLSRL